MSQYVLLINKIKMKKKKIHCTRYSQSLCQALTTMCVVLSHVQLSAAPLTIARQAPLSV